ncbi:hypothetical protein ACVRWL_10270 [Streptococcus ratti]|uniref:Uncharacterized protein n=1 Tax=Streptococcus ratti TaxID=1341 RepID=A0A7X9QI96_STRRT|nr:hypothetical protein [Streptococcus ratti]NMD50020.1 hypothetical protein [Streptococcus ratti]
MKTTDIFTFLNHHEILTSYELSQVNGGRAGSTGLGVLDSTVLLQKRSSANYYKEKGTR